MSKIRPTAAAILLATIAVTAKPVDSQVIERINLNSDEIQSNSAGMVPKSTRVVSADGRYVVFSSIAGDLVEDDTNARLDVYVYDRVSDQIFPITGTRQ